MSTSTHAGHTPHIIMNLVNDLNRHNSPGCLMVIIIASKRCLEGHGFPPIEDLYLNLANLNIAHYTNDLLAY